MKRSLCTCFTVLFLNSISMIAQVESTPLYRVTVIERNIDAVSYDYRSYPTSINFQGTILLHTAKGSASVQSKRGRTEIDARFEKLTSPQQFGSEHLTYVLWAITPEGRPHNLGELVVNDSDHAQLRVTTDLQTFGMMVTAEPYSAVRRPSDVVVLENRIRPDTIGIIKPIHAKFELLPRGHYVWQVPSSLKAGPGSIPRVSMDRYEALLQVYEAQNALGIARQANAQQHAPDTLARAELLWRQAQQYQHDKATLKRSVQLAREAIQTAEDARLIAEHRTREEQLTAAQSQATLADQARIQANLQAEAEVQRARNEADAARQARLDAETQAGRARAEADAARAQAESERIARERMEADVNRVKAGMLLDQQRQEQLAAQKRLRVRLLQELNGTLPTRDTPRGLVVTLPDTAFHGADLRGSAADQVAKVRWIVGSQSGLLIEVQGHCDSAATERLSERRAEEVRGVLVRGGLPLAVSVRGFGDSAPIVSNSSPSGRQQNRRVEIVIAGDPLGNHPLWDHTYTLRLQR